MSKFGNVWIKSVYCLMMFALLAAALVLSGCSGYGAGFDNGSGSAGADFDSSTDSVSDGTDTPDITGSVNDSLDTPGVDTDPVSNGTNLPDSNDDPVGYNCWADSDGYILEGNQVDAGASFWIKGNASGTIGFTK